MIMNNELTFVPFGGSANRMQTIASAVNLARRTGVKVDVVWFREWAMEARYDELFNPFAVNGVTLRDASWWEYYVYDRPRKKNMWVPLLPQKMLYDSVLRQENIVKMVNDGFNFESWAVKGRRNIMPCCMKFGAFEDYGALIRELFHPVNAVMDEVQRYKVQFSSHTIGAHIRRTDSAVSIKNSPLEKFMENIDAEIAANADTKIFLATDDEPTRQALTARYGSRIITSARPATRANVDGIRDGLVDMWTLASTDIIYGSVGSSFSVMASAIGGNKLKMVGSD